MSDPQSGSELEQDDLVQESPCLQELKLFKPLSSDLSGQSREASPTWRKPQYNMNLGADAVDGSVTRKRGSDELSCELGLGVWENPRRVCRICHRHFASGRALGGHMRVHGPLFQPAGSKRKLMNSLKSQGLLRDVSDSKDSNLSVLSKNLSEELLEFGGSDEAPVDTTTDSEGEAVDDARTSEAYLHHLRRAKEYEDDGEFDDVHDYVDVRGHGVNKHAPIGGVDDAHLFTTMAPIDRNPLYKLRDNPKKSRRFAEEDEFAMEMFLAGQGANGSSSLSYLERPRRVCSECGKSFLSWKALAGHMRCHPERDWRGILPPEDGSMPEERIRSAKKKLFAVSRIMESSDYDLDSDVDDKEFGTEVLSSDSKKSALMVKGEQLTEHNVDDDGIGEEDDYGREDDGHRRWPTGKRSRRKFVEGKAESSVQHFNFPSQREEPALTSESGSQEEQQQGEMPNFLLMLAEAARKIEKETLARKSALLVRMPAQYESKHYGGGGHEDRKHEGEAFNIGMSAKQMQATTSSTSGMVKYECSTCKKSFNSHQALGGHRASHRKMKGCFGEETWQAHHVHQKDPSPLQHVVDKDMIASAPQQFKGHECSICHRMFSTGQALGGHKRCHYIGKNVTEAASFTSSNKQITCEEGHSISRLDTTDGGSTLDLNMPAPEGEDDEVADVSARLHLFGDKLESKVSKQRMSSEELSLAPWASRKELLDGRRGSSWELDSRWAMGSAIAY